MNIRNYRLKKTGTRGATMIEMLAYTFILVLLVSVVVYTLITLNNLYRSIKATAGIESAAHVALERMVRDIRAASSVDLANSVLGSSPGQLALYSFDDAGATTTTQFLMVGSELHLKKAGVDTGPLTQEGVRITNLVFRYITAVRSRAIKIEMQVESGAGKNLRSESFYSTSVLRGSYPLQ